MEKKTIKGKVVSTKMKNTAVLEIAIERRHPVYGKRYTKYTRIKAENLIKAKLGDMVLAVETRPLSRSKRHLITKII
ncbi:30S ribosomal protein S17 [candidate division WWE3 bacterium CG_4_10_14_0_2_um_filter_42_7]|uniref:30S ribosomal protein S17 n=2 Tax=Katanobacteria TaxID=422282 RepID=A0A2H0X8M4_UNCKA|nr:MAG: 30S ribosomal protein S17 [candidate division WWE3 bacterium CG08_land_8_20_14_0_20_41_15]PIZ42942.1 MAG: 30S ribosomal protein S17 [candidate division WWE3 bacterium CG_4_10_14_0_2_um_filter_42_7]